VKPHICHTTIQPLRRFIAYNSFSVSLVIGICGGSGSGKTTLAQKAAEGIRQQWGSNAATVISFDAYYHDQSNVDVATRATVNYDHPDSLEADLLISHIQQLKLGCDVDIPVYDFTQHTRSPQTQRVEASDVVVIEGILLFSYPELRNEFDYRAFRDCPESVRFERRLRRDIHERGRSPASIRQQLQTTVKPMHDQYVQPHSDSADFVTYHGEDLEVVADKLVEQIQSLDVCRSGTRSFA